MSRVTIQQTWADGDNLTIQIDADDSSPLSLVVAMCCAVQAYHGVAAVDEDE